MTDVQEQVSVPQASSTLGNALAKLVSDISAAKASGATGAALVAAIGADVVSDLVGALGSLPGLAGEISAEPIGVAEAFAIAGFQVARSLSGK